MLFGYGAPSKNAEASAILRPTRGPLCSSRISGAMPSLALLVQAVSPRKAPPAGTSGARGPDTLRGPGADLFTTVKEALPSSGWLGPLLVRTIEHCLHLSRIAGLREREPQKSPRFLRVQVLRGHEAEGVVVNLHIARHPATPDP